MCNILIPDSTGLPELLITFLLLMRLKCGDKGVMALLRILMDTSMHLCVLENDNFRNYMLDCKLLVQLTLVSCTCITFL